MSVPDKFRSHKVEKSKVAGVVIVRVQSSLRLSRNYQSSENIVGIDLPCVDDPAAIKAAAERGWDFVDEQLSRRVLESEKALKLVSPER